ncbi:hypothetical protein T03_2135 [Trichinella britovi]|uniref:Uncharacterized protein n=1 Tax=Trichinella britovi TaxID=45882 RepID=A0A0V1D9M4_TRIBR|nr:hypothetical protein T03_2135 [Trichinella britovi]
MEHFGKLMKQNEFTVIIVLGKKKSKTMPHPPSRGHSSHWQKFILLALVERVLLQSVYVEDAKKMKETLDSVSAQLQVVYQQKLRLQKNLKEKVEAEEQLQNGMEQFKHNGVQCALLRCEEETCRSEEYSRKSASHELESVKQQLKELQKDFEALENTKNNLTSQLNFQKAECQEKLNNLTSNIPSNGKPAPSNDTSATANQNAASVCDKQFSAVITFGTL